MAIKPDAEFLLELPRQLSLLGCVVQAKPLIGQHFSHRLYLIFQKWIEARMPGNFIEFAIFEVERFV